MKYKNLHGLLGGFPIAPQTPFGRQGFMKI